MRGTRLRESVLFGVSSGAFVGRAIRRAFVLIEFIC